MIKDNFLYLGALMLGIAACGDDSIIDNDPEIGFCREVVLQAEIDQLNPSRADDSGFADGDRIGIYAVDFSEAGSPGHLTPSGNHADNVAYTFAASGNKWETETPVYFTDDTPPMDFYGYYPYNPVITDVEAMPFSVKTDQSKSYGTISGYEASDFLWGKKAGVRPADGTVNLTFKHILASVEVTLEEGPGFDDGEWSSLDKHVIVTGTGLDATVDLSNGSVRAGKDSKTVGIIAAAYKDSFRAIVIPQAVEADNPLFSITAGGQTYKFVKEEPMIYHQGKIHKFVIKVTKSLPKGDYEFSLLDESVTMWESDLLSHDGAAKEYIVVNNYEKGKLQWSIKSMGLDPSEIVNLKITGEMSDDDYEYIRTNMSRLEAVNLYEVYTMGNSAYYGNTEYCLPIRAFYSMKSLKSCVLPRKLKVIGEDAFRLTSLTGSLDIPEGVEQICSGAYASTNLTGTLTLPSTLMDIRDEAFRGCDFTGELILPDGLKSIGDYCFHGCKFLTGGLRIPDSVKTIGFSAFTGMEGISGWLVLPKDLNEIRGFSGYGDNTGISVDGIIWPDCPKSIQHNAFSFLKIRSDIVIPETVESLGTESFAHADIRHVKLPSNISIVPQDCFRACSELTDTLVIPEKVRCISGNAFFRCDKLKAIILSASLERIEERAFAGCLSLQYIRCDAKEPPILGDEVFSEVAKNNFTVEVPEESVDAYRNAPGWCEFKRIAAYKNFVARPSKYNVLNKGGKKEIVLNADEAWEMTDCPTWCHVDKTSGEKKTVLTLTVDEMAKGSPMRSGNVRFRLKGNKEYTTHINIGQFDYEYDEDQPLTLQKATKGNGIDLVFLGDGYDASDISSGAYLEDMKQEMEYLFGVEPYTTYRDYFNVFTSIALSEDSGVESLDRWRKTKFGVSIGDGWNQRISADFACAFDYCAEIFPATVESRTEPRVGCILVSNTDIYEGVTYNVGESFCSVVTKSGSGYPLDARGLVQHEAGGHGIGWLGDEYVRHLTHFRNCPCPCCGHESELKAQQASGFALNLSLTGIYKDVSWSHLIFNPSYQDIVDVYEGGYFHKRGVYRSEINSCMNNNVPYFSTWSRQLIVQRIMKLAGETFSLDSFYANDSRSTGSDFSSTSRGGAADAGGITARRCSPPVRITNYKYGKKGGKR